MELLKAVFLGIIQGVTEFLPISSSGHLLIFEKLLNFRTEDYGITFEILLHVGTLISIFIVYYKDLINLIKEGILFLIDCCKLKPDINKNEDRKMVVLILVSMIPTGIIGLLLEGTIKTYLTNVKIVGIFLMITSALLFLSSRKEKQSGEVKDAKKASLWDGFIVGVMQGVAVCPGLSRSGTTISTGLIRSFQKELAVKFSFFMSIPIILAASLKDILLDQNVKMITGTHFAGAIAATIAGVLSIKFLIKMLKSKRFDVFAYYTLIVGMIVLLFL